MQCPKCKTENSDKIIYCVRCHTPLKYTCPSCKHVQLQGGKCEKCGVDFAKYAAMLIFQAKDAAQFQRKKAGWRPPIWAHIVFFPFPALIQLTLYLIRRARSK
jgi:PHP family Zn ribbon phosphoesterase